jgi:hypothetical protein
MRVSGEALMVTAAGAGKLQRDNTAPDRVMPESGLGA